MYEMRNLKTREKIAVEALFVDLDGTLVDSIEAYAEAVKQGLASIGITKFDKRIVKAIAKNFEMNRPLEPLLQPIIQKIMPQKVSAMGMPPLTSNFVENYLKTYYAVTATKCKPLKNVHRTLQTLSKRLPLVLITMRFISKEQAVSELKCLGFCSFFQEVVTARDIEKPKPHPDSLVKSARKLNVSLERCAIVGDSIVDVKAGKAADAKTVAVLTGLYTQEELEKEKPDLILKSINQLPKFLIFPEKAETKSTT